MVYLSDKYVAGNLIVLIYNIIRAYASDLDTLQLVNVLFRHGDRTPVEIFPNDEHKSHWVEQALGQLTMTGVQESIELGKFMRDRYNGFINDTYIASEIYMRSTDVDRCLTTAQAVFQGMYALPETYRAANISVNPIPVHTVPEDLDQLLAKAECAVLSDDWSRVQHSPDVYNDVRSKYETFLEMVHQAAGYDWVFPHSGDIFGSAKNIYDTLYIENLKNLTLPDWANMTVMHKFETEIIPRIWDLMFYNKKIVQLTGGQLLNKIITDMELRKQSLFTDKKMFFYSGHDTTVLSLLAAMGLFRNITPGYTATLYLEYHNDEANSVDFVRVFYKSGPEMDLEQLQLPGCELDCSLNKFSDVTKDYRISDRNRECQGEDNSHKDYKHAIIVAISVSISVFVIVLVAMVTVGFIIMHKRRTSSVQYRDMTSPDVTFDYHDDDVQMDDVSENV